MIPLAVFLVGIVILAVAAHFSDVMGKPLIILLDESGEPIRSLEFCCALCRRDYFELHSDLDCVGGRSLFVGGACEHCGKFISA